MYVRTDVQIPPILQDFVSSSSFRSRCPAHITATITKDDHLLPLGDWFIFMAESSLCIFLLVFQGSIQYHIISCLFLLFPLQDMVFPFFTVLAIFVPFGMLHGPPLNPSIKFMVAYVYLHILPVFV